MNGLSNFISNGLGIGRSSSVDEEEPSSSVTGDQNPLVDPNPEQQDPHSATKNEEESVHSDEDEDEDERPVHGDEDDDKRSVYTPDEEHQGELDVGEEGEEEEQGGDLQATVVQGDGATQQQGQEEEEVPQVAEGISGNTHYDPSGMPHAPGEEKATMPNEMELHPSVHQQSSSPKTSSSHGSAKRSFDSSSGGGDGMPPSGNTVPGYVIPLPPAPVTTGVEDVSPDDFFRDFRKMMTETLLKTQTAVNDTQSTLSSVLTNQIQMVHADLNNSISHFSTLLESEMMDLRYLNQLPDINLHQLANRCEFRHVRTANVLNTLANVWIEQFSIQRNEIRIVTCPSMVSLLDTIKAFPEKKYFIVSACIFHHFQVENTHHVSILARMRMVIENDDPNVDDDRIMFYYLLKRGF